MQTGTVKWFNPAKGFGFIQPDQGGPDVFVHISAVEKAGMRSLNEGQKLRFELQSDPKSRKTSAHNLQKADGGAPKSVEADKAQDQVDEDDADESEEEDSDQDESEEDEEEEGDEDQAANG